jgi:lipopolysaccharide/colanic/teichoic acid biosynthesis glycosyltransferase
MSLQSVISLVSTPRPYVRSGRRRAALPSALLHLAVKKERARSDRSGNPFYWVLFRLEGTHVKKRMVQSLGELIVARTRDTDEVGWFDETAVCAILPETERAGVQSYVADVVRLAADQHLHPVAFIQGYPTISTPRSDPPTDRPSSLIRRERDATVQTLPGLSLGVEEAASASHQRNSLLAVEERFLVRMPWWKRIADIVGGAAGLLLLAPILLAAALAVRISSCGPIFFVQQRAGLGGRPFPMYKFRTMHIDAEALKVKLRNLNERDGPAFKMKNDPRLTPVGSFLRSFSIDELPQLFNVLKGDMSLVGPRPPTFDEIGEYRRWYLRRLEVTPGITCIWQVRGRAEVSFERWMRMDIEYIQNYGFWQDLKLLVATIPAVLLRRGAH